MSSKMIHFHIISPETGFWILQLDWHLLALKFLPNSAWNSAETIFSIVHYPFCSNLIMYCPYCFSNSITKRDAEQNDVRITIVGCFSIDSFSFLVKPFYSSYELFSSSNNWCVSSFGYSRRSNIFMTNAILVMGFSQAKKRLFLTSMLMNPWSGVYSICGSCTLFLIWWCDICSSQPPMIVCT